MAAILVSASGILSGMNTFWATMTMLAASYVDTKLFSPSTTIEGSRLNDLKVSGSGFGNAVGRNWGVGRFAGNIIWTTDLVEHQEKTTSGGGKGGGGGGGEVTQISYWYSCSFAIAICAGPVAQISRIWANNKVIYNVRRDASDGTRSASLALGNSLAIYLGTETQTPNATMQAYLGAANVPAYRGYVYIVFNNFSLKDYGNAMPSFNFEVVQNGHFDSGYVVADAVGTDKIISDLSKSAGLTTAQFDVSELSSYLLGFTTGSENYEDSISKVCHAANITFRQDGDKIVFFPWQRPGVSVDIPQEDIIVDDSTSDDGKFQQVEIVRKKEISLPKMVSVNFTDPGRDYQVNTQRSVKHSTNSVQQLSIETNATMTPTAAVQLADRLLYGEWLGREQFTFSVGPKYLGLVCGDVVNLAVRGAVHSLQIRKIELGANWRIKISARRYGSSIFQSTREGGSGTFDPKMSEIIVGGSTQGYLLNLPALLDDHNTPGYFVAATGADEDWRYANVYQSVDNGLTWSYVTKVGSATTIGSAVTALNTPSKVGWVDPVNTVDVELVKGTLSSYPFEDVLKGSNIALLGKEIIQFENATLIAENTYRLSGLVRGRRGTEGMVNTHVEEELFCLLGGTVFVPIQISEINQPKLFRFVSNNSNLEAQSNISFTCTGETLRPFSPVRGYSTNVDGNYEIYWTRRGRIGQEMPSGADIALSEEVEKYGVEVVESSTGTVKRFTYVTTPTWTYMQADRLADFPGGGAVTINVYQISAIVGKGTPLKIII